MTQDWARPVVHWEIRAADPQRLRAFYSEMFNWTIGDGPIMDIPAGVGGPQTGPGGHIRASDRGGVTLYIQVADLTRSLARTVALGGTIIRERLEAPTGATLAFINDPEGNPVVLVQQ